MWPGTRLFSGLYRVPLDGYMSDVPGPSFSLSFPDLDQVLFPEDDHLKSFLKQHAQAKRCGKGQLALLRYLINWNLNVGVIKPKRHYMDLPYIRSTTMKAICHDYCANQRCLLAASQELRSRITRHARDRDTRTLSSHLSPVAFSRLEHDTRAIQRLRQPPCLPQVTQTRTTPSQKTHTDVSARSVACHQKRSNGCFQQLSIWI